MCLITFAYNVSEEYPLILIANRDEFYARPTEKAHFWKEEGSSEILAGKDLRGGGTWFGISKKGKWAAVTNHRDLKNIKENAPTRGTLIPNFLKSNHSCEDYLSSLQTEVEKFNGFNLLLGDDTGIFHYSNVSNVITKIEPGIHGVSNALLNTPWPKLEKAKSRFAEEIQKGNIDRQSLFSILKDQEVAATHQLPKTGLSDELEKAMSSIFIDTPNYGTRCSSLLFINQKGEMKFVERRYDSQDSSIVNDEIFSL